jgi:hypothetical protein
MASVGSCRSWQQHDDLDDRLDLGARYVALTSAWFLASPVIAIASSELMVLVQTEP